MPKKYPDEFKVKAVRRYEKDESIQTLCQELHISQSTLCSIHTPTHTYTPKEFDSITGRLQKAEHKLEIIQLSGYISKVPLQNRLATLEHLHNEFSEVYSVHELCEALDVARDTFYNHLFRRADRTQYENEQAQLALRIKQIFDDSEQRYGAEKIRVILAESGLRVSAKRISAIMRELGLYSIRTDAKKHYKAQQQRKKQNLLNREFHAKFPNQIWISDITYFKIKDSWLYLCVIIDLFSRKVIAHRISHSIGTRLVTTTFRAAYNERGTPKDLIFHSDRGVQYTSKSFSKISQQCGAKQSFSATARPHDNAVAEAFFTTFKKEEAYRREYTSERHFRQSVDEYIRFYNEVRPHAALKYKTPQAFEAAYASDFIEKTCLNSGGE